MWFLLFTDVIQQHNITVNTAIIVQFVAQKHAPVVYYHLILTNLASVLMFSDIMMISIIVIPYSGKVWQGEILAILVNHP